MFGKHACKKKQASHAPAHSDSRLRLNPHGACRRLFTPSTLACTLAECMHAWPSASSPRPHQTGSQFAAGCFIMDAPLFSRVDAPLTCASLMVLQGPFRFTILTHDSFTFLYIHDCGFTSVSVGSEHHGRMARSAVRLVLTCQAVRLPTRSHNSL